VQSFPWCIEQHLLRYNGLAATRMGEHGVHMHVESLANNNIFIGLFLQVCRFRKQSYDEA